MMRHDRRTRRGAPSLRNSMWTSGALLIALSGIGCTSSLPSAFDNNLPGPKSQPSPTHAKHSDLPPPQRILPERSDEDAEGPSERAVDVSVIATSFAGAAPKELGVAVTGVHATHNSSGVALTLDACGGPGGAAFDRELIDGLVSRGIPATLFVNARWIEENPEVIRDLAQDPLFELANHGTDHVPLSVTGQAAYGIPGTSTPEAAAREVWNNHVLLKELTGKAPRYFRSGTAHYDDVAVQIVKSLGEEVIGFDVNADGGATLDAQSVYEQMLTAGPGSIVIAHFNQPSGQTAEGLLAAIDAMTAQGIVFTHIDELR